MESTNKIRLLPKLLSLGACGPAMFEIQQLALPTAEDTAAYMQEHHRDWWDWLLNTLHLDGDPSVRRVIRALCKAAPIEISVETHFYLGIDIAQINPVRNYRAVDSAVMPALSQWRDAAKDHCPFAEPTACTARVLMNYLKKHDPANHAVLRDALDKAKRNLPIQPVLPISDDAALQLLDPYNDWYAVEVGSVILSECHDEFSRMGSVAYTLANPKT